MSRATINRQSTINRRGRWKSARREFPPRRFPSPPTKETTMRVTLLKRDDLPRSGHTYDFEGALHGETPISFIWVDLPPGDGPRLHKHAYDEIIIIQEGRGTF